MKLIVGLGNPGPQYETTRHNAGFLAADFILDNWSGMRSAREQSKFQSLARSGVSPSGVSCLIVKPQTFMNLSGQSVGEWVRFHKIRPEDVIVLQDEIDLPIGTLRIKQGGGHGGHNGLKSLDAHLSSKDYYRVRIGVGRSAHADVSHHVLGAFSDEEWQELETVFPKIADAVDLLCNEQLERAQQAFNSKTSSKDEE
jgi:PTH1 family peptidyl-tRNA hydrolase